MFGRSRLRDTIMGCFMYSDFTIVDCVASEEVAVKAMNGTSVCALSPPSLLNDGLKSEPLPLNVIIGCMYDSHVTRQQKILGNKSYTCQLTVYCIAT